MCGIFGIVLNDRSLHSSSALINDLEVLYSSAMLRGQDATGIAVNDGKSISVLRRECKPTEMVKGEDFKNLILEPFKTSVHEPLAVMGHSRLVTNGSLAIKENNQPVCTGQLVGIHNGIVTNASSLQNTLNNATNPPPNQIDPKTQAWADKNEWFGNDQIMTMGAFTIDKQLKQEGFDPSTDEYYTEIDKRIARNFPQQGNQTRPTQKVGSAARTSSTERRTVKLTPSQVAIAKKLGVPLEEYAKHVKEA